MCRTKGILCLRALEKGVEPRLRGVIEGYIDPGEAVWYTLFEGRIVSGESYLG